jgi:hypothetical protein
MVREEVSIRRVAWEEVIRRVDIASRFTTMEVISFTTMGTTSSITIETVSSIIIVILTIAFSLGLVSHIMAIHTMTTIRTITDIMTTTGRPMVTSIGAI